MTDTDIRKRLKDYIVETTYAEPDSFDDNTPLFEAGIFDSMGLLLLIDFLQEHYDVEVSDEELTIENFESINTIVRFVGSQTLSEVS